MIAKLKALGMSVLARNVRLRVTVRRVRTRLLYVRYRWHARCDIDDHLIVFESFVGRIYAGSPRALYESMLDDPRFAACRFVWAFRDPDHVSGFASLQNSRTAVVAFGSASYYRAFARASVWISNSVLAPELVPRKQLYVQTWHGTGIKRIGFDVVSTTKMAMNEKAEIDERYRIEASKIDLFVSPAPFGTKVFASAFGLPAVGPDSPFVEIGNPRNDALAVATQAQVATARARLEVPDGVKAILYAPTLRDDQYEPGTGYVFNPPLDLAALAATLMPDHVILYRAHYLVSPPADLRRYGEFVRDVSAVDEVNDILLASDVLVTDYSSLCFDFLLLDRPMLFYVYDLDSYGNDTRGFYFPVQDLPGPLVRTQDELVAALLDQDLPVRDAQRRHEHRQRMCPYDDGHVSARVLDLIVPRLSL